VARTGTEAVKHTVKSGETLSTIARKYGVKQGDIAVANNISDPQKIRVGMELVIPGWQAPAGKTGHAKSGSTDGTARHDAETKSSPPVSDAPVDSPPRNSSSDVPVIQVEEAPAPAPAK
jgi:LysM repeat protein